MFAVVRNAYYIKSLSNTQKKAENTIKKEKESLIQRLIVFHRMKAYPPAQFSLAGEDLSLILNLVNGRAFSGVFEVQLPTINNKLKQTIGFTMFSLGCGR